MAYNLETVLAEKIETVLSRSIANTRPRDFYDIHIIFALRGNECDKTILKQALERTSVKRGSSEVFIMMLETILSECDRRQRNHQCGSCGVCSYENYCPKNCENCLDYIHTPLHAPNGAPDRKAHKC